MSPERGVRRGEGIPLLFIHGNGVDHRNLLPLDGALERVGGFERIYLDLPGFGSEPALPAPGGLPDFADWLHRQVDRLVPEAPFALFGQSMGALLAQELADRFPGRIRGLGLLAPVVYPALASRSVPPRQVVREDLGLMSRLEPSQRAAYEELSVLRTAPNWERFSRHVLPGIGGANLRAMARLSKGYDLDPLPVDRPEVGDFPVAAICARQDHVVGFRDALRLRRRYADFRLVVVDRAGHNLHIDQPGQVGQAVEDWARRVRAHEPGNRSHAAGPGVRGGVEPAAGVEGLTHE